MVGANWALAIILCGGERERRKGMEKGKGSGCLMVYGGYLSHYIELRRSFYIIWVINVRIINL
jgi:hypothetical protein